MFDAFKPPSSPFEQPSTAYRILTSPLKFVIQNIYALQLFLRRSTHELPPRDQRVRFLCISDTHCLQPTNLPPADVLIHAGDLTNEGTIDQIQKQIDWLTRLNYRYKILIAGNHDSYFDPRSRRAEDRGRELEWPGEEQNVHYLQHSSITLQLSERGNRRLKIYGAPQIPACGGPDFAFQYLRGQDAWSSTVPIDTDILVTHSPPRHHLDLPRGMGCEWLLKELWRVRPRLHVFGHIHCGYGQEHAFWDEAQTTYERICEKGENGVVGRIFTIWPWVDGIRFVVHSVTRILWSRVWGGNDKSTLLVNSALMLGSTGTLGNVPQVVEI